MTTNSRVLERCRVCQHAKWSGDECRKCAHGIPLPKKERKFVVQDHEVVIQTARVASQDRVQARQTPKPIHWRDELKNNPQKGCITKATVTVRGRIRDVVNMTPEQLRNVADYYIRHGEDSVREYIRYVGRGRHKWAAEQILEIMREHEQYEDKKRGL
jgi:hypothetical protein